MRTASHVIKIIRKKIRFLVQEQVEQDAKTIQQEERNSMPRTLEEESSYNDFATEYNVAMNKVRNEPPTLRRMWLMR